MKKGISEPQQWVHKFTNPTFMKFLPTRDYEMPTESPPQTFVQGLRQFFGSLLNTNRPTPPLKPTPTLTINPLQSNGEQRKENRLRFVRRLTNDDVLIGNEDQLDGIQICGIIDGFVDTEHLWSIGLNKPILHVEIDSRKGYIIILPQGELLLYQYRPKAIRDKPNLITSLQLIQQVKFVQVVKDALVLCYRGALEVYNVYENPGELRIRAKKNYDLAKGKDKKLKIFQVPQPCDNVLNIFFEESNEKEGTFNLWNIEVQFLAKQVKMGQAANIYNLPLALRSSLLLQNYSNQIYFINTGEEIYAIKKGYIIDVARVDKHTEGSHLRYFPPSTLLHISSDKMEVYRFSLTHGIPTKIALASTDSIQIPSAGDSYQYLDAVQLNGDNYGLFLQSKIGHNRRLKGQIKYAFVVSHFVKFQQKIKTILPSQVRTVNQQRIEQRADMAAKMGLQRKNIYLRLWNNSSKCQVQDYKLLLDTLDYDTIRAEIEKKLKKTSMNYRQVLLIEQGCLSMLAKSVFSQQCTKDHLRNYLISHLLVRKLRFYRQIASIDKQARQSREKQGESEEGKLMINIQNYNHFKTLDIRAMLLELIGQLINQDKDTVPKIKALIKHFRFPLRTIYLDLLSDIITSSKKKFLKVLQVLPEILPCMGQGNSDGIWQVVNEQQWQNSLYLDTLSTIENKECLEELTESVWFRRYWLTQHDYVNLTRQQIQELQKRNSSDTPFLHALQRVFEVIKEHAPLRAIVDLLQDSYPRLPIHLLGKIFLYHRLHEHFKANQNPSQPEEERVGRFSQFLQWRDPQVFRAMFSYQKLRKGFILKEMKEQFGKYSSAETFREGLLNYFASPLSEISDIKYLLNRMNNEKREFHEENEGLYQVLVRGMQLKLTLGSPDDVPAGEVLIYIQNIPLPQHNPVFRDLQTLRAINRQAQRFRQMKLNMSIFAITKNMQDVISSVVTYRVNAAQIQKVCDYSELRELSYVIVEDVMTLKMNLYENSQDNFIVAFIYLSKLCEYEGLLQFVGKLVQDELFSKFAINSIRLENLVLYMYKWKLSKEPSYLTSSSYLQKLVAILPQESPCRRFISAQVEIAVLLGSTDNPIKYPLNNGEEYFTSSELQNLISKMQAQHLLQLDVDRLFQLVCTVQILATDREKSEITIRRLREMVVMRMLDCSLLVQVLPIVRQLMEISGQSSSNFMYPCLIISKIASELVEENKNILIQCASHLVNNPIQLINLLEQLIKLVSTTTEQRNFLMKALENAKTQHNINFNTSNPILEKTYINLAENQQQIQSCNAILRNQLRFVSKIKEQFASAHFSLAFIILCNDPYILPSYLFSIRFQINFKHFRAFLSYLTKEDFFDKNYLVQFSKRMFIILYEAVKYNKNIEELSIQYRQMPLDTQKDFEKISEFANNLQRTLGESIERMKAKGKSIANQFDRRWAKGQLQSKQDKQKRIKERLNNPTDPTNKEYPFIDSDDNTNKITAQIRRSTEQKEKKIPQFDSSFERSCLGTRDTASLKIYLSVQTQNQLKIKFKHDWEERNSIFKNLSIDKEKPTSTELNDAIRNSIRRSRSKTRNVDLPSGQNRSSNTSNHFLIVKPTTPTPPPEKQSQGSLLKSQLKGNEQKLEVISVQMPSKSLEIPLEVLPQLPFEGKTQSNQQKNNGDTEVVCELKTQTANEIKTEVYELKSETVHDAKEIELANKNEELKADILLTKVQSFQIKKQAKQVPPTMESIQPILQEEIKLEDVHKCEPAVGDTLAQVKIINLILANLTPITEQTILDFTILSPYSSHPSFKAFLEELITTIYHKIDISLIQVLYFIKALDTAYPILRINRPFLDIYERAEKLQSKFNLELPLKSLMGPQGLLLENQNSDALFRYLLPRIVGQLDEEQLIKACKVITLSFKKSELQQEIMLHYLLSLLERYELAHDNPMLASREKGMLRQKIEVILGKIPVRLLGKREEEIFGLVSKEVRLDVARMVIDSCRARYDTKVADHLEQKYIPQK